MALQPLCSPDDNPLAVGHLKRQIQWLLFLRVIFLSLILGISVFLSPTEYEFLLPPQHLIAYFIAGVYLFTIISAFVLRATTCLKRFGYLQLTIDTFLVTCLVFFTGGSQSVCTVVYFFPIVAGAFMLFRPGGLLFASLSTILYGVLLYLELKGYLTYYFRPTFAPIYDIQLLLQFFSIHGLTFFLVALLSSMLSERLQQAEADLFRTSSSLDRLSRLYKQIFDDITTGIITVDDKDSISSFNRAAEVITGFTESEVLGGNCQELFPGLLVNAHLQERPVTSLQQKDGESIPVGYSWAKLNTPDGNGESKVFTMQDLSQIAAMEAKVKQAEKMAAIGEMAAGVAHEFRNPLAAISGAAQLLAQDMPTDNTHKRLVEIIGRESDRLEASISEFLMFSRPSTPEKKWHSLLSIVTEAQETLAQSPSWDESISVLLDIPEKLECWADPQLLRQILLNLISNSSQAIYGHDGTGKIIVSAEELHVGKNEQISVSVEDNGPGIQEKALGKIFEPFFTTRENGTGLGLAIVKQIAESHGGKITAANTPPKGTTFTLTLPLP